MNRRVLLGLVLGAAALRALFFSGGSLYDDLAYLRRVVQLVGGDLSPPTEHFEARLGLIGPPALVCAVLGVGLFNIVIYPSACSLGSVVVAYLIAHRPWGPRAATLAGLLAAIAPLELIYASQLYATAPIIFLTGLGFGLFLVAEREPRPRAWLYLTSGAAIGAATLAHETAILTLVFYPVHALLVARPRRVHVAAMAGLGLALAVDPLVHGLMGDPLAHLHLLTAPHGTMMATEYLPWTLGWLGEPLLRVFSEQELGLFPWLVAPIAALRAFGKGDPTRRALALIVAAVALWVLYGTISFHGWETLVRAPRYLAPIVLPSIWLLARELDGWRPRWRRAALAALVASSLLCALVDGGRARLVPYRQLSAFLDRAGATRVVGDWRAMLALRLADGFSPRRTAASFEEAPHPAPGTLVVLGDDAWAPPYLRLEPVAEIPPASSVYRRLLENPLVQRVLRLVRGAERMRSLGHAADRPALTVLRVR